MNLINLLFKKKEKKEEIQDIIPEEILSAVKKSTKDSAESHSFLEDFEYPVRKKEIIDISEYRLIDAEKITSEYKEKLKSSIVISLYGLNVQRSDLEFICKSRIDGRPIYRYIGHDFSKFDIPYEELVSIEDVLQIPRLTSPDVERDSLIEYCDYLADQLDRNIAYSEYVAESISKM
jgi:hypothetical protein